VQEDAISKKLQREETMTAYDTTEARPELTRRAALKAAAAAGATLAMPAIAPAASEDTIRIGFISPVTGPLGLFGETDSYTLEKIRKHFSNGLEIGGKTYQVKVFDRDAQSDPNKASELAGDLILNEKIHLMIPASTTDMRAQRRAGDLRGGAVAGSGHASRG
jgi:branched-chain amino acid transport system substrate-binding protein